MCNRFIETDFSELNYALILILVKQDLLTKKLFEKLFSEACQGWRDINQGRSWFPAMTFSSYGIYKVGCLYCIGKCS